MPDDIPFVLRDELDQRIYLLAQCVHQTSFRIAAERGAIDLPHLRTILESFRPYFHPVTIAARSAGASARRLPRQAICRSGRSRMRSKP